MKCCIIGNKNLSQMTLMSLYTDYFDKNYIKYDVIYADRYNVNENCNAESVYRFEFNQKQTNNYLLRYIEYKILECKFRYFITSIIKKEKYDFLVIWREETAVLLKDFLKKHYKQRYSVNIRDLMNGKRFNKELGETVKYSAFNTVSSDGFIPYLPKSEYLFVHSMNENIVNQLRRNKMKNLDKKIVITCIGTFRNDAYCFGLVRAFNNDKRFVLQFIGRGSERMGKYAKEHNFDNVQCVGAFKPEETASLLMNTDILNCAYGVENSAETTKLPIRFYYAVYLGIPILATCDTWMMKTADELHMAISVPSIFDDNTCIADYVYKKYCEIDSNIMNEKIDAYKKKIEESHIAFENLMNCYLSNTDI